MRQRPKPLMRRKQRVKRTLAIEAGRIFLRADRRLECGEQFFRDIIITQIAGIMEGDEDLIGDGAPCTPGDY